MMKDVLKNGALAVAAVALATVGPVGAADAADYILKYGHPLSLIHI